MGVFSGMPWLAMNIICIVLIASFAYHAEFIRALIASGLWFLFNLVWVAGAYYEENLD